MTPRIKFITISLAGILINVLTVVAIGYFLYSPILTAYQGLQTSRRELASLEKRARLIKDLERTNTELKPEFDKISASFLTQNNVVAFLDMLRDIAAETHVEHSVVSGKLAEANALEKGSNFSVVLKGSFPNEYQFLKKIENAPFVIDIPEMSLGVTDETNTSMSLTLKVLTGKPE